MAVGIYIHYFVQYSGPGGEVPVFSVNDEKPSVLRQFVQGVTSGLWRNPNSRVSPGDG